MQQLTQQLTQQQLHEIASVREHLKGLSGQLPADHRLKSVVNAHMLHVEITRKNTIIVSENFNFSNRGEHAKAMQFAAQHIYPYAILHKHAA